MKGILQTALCRVFEAIPKLRSVGIPVEKSYSAECLLEKSFTHFVERKRHLIGDDEGLAIYESDLMDQLILLCKFTQDEAKRSRPVIQAAFKDFLASYLNAIQGKTDLFRLQDPDLKGTVRARLCQLPSEEKLDAAAVIIQSNYKGYKIRKNQLLSQLPTGKEPIYKCLDQSEAAVKIQSVYRGYRTRKELCNMLETAPASLEFEKQLQSNLLGDIRKEKFEEEVRKETERRIAEKAFADTYDTNENFEEQITKPNIEAWLDSTDNIIKEVVEDEAKDGYITDAVTSSRLSMDEFVTEDDNITRGDDKFEDMTEDEEDDWRTIVEPQADFMLTEDEKEEIVEGTEEFEAQEETGELVVEIPEVTNIMGGTEETTEVVETQKVMEDVLEGDPPPQDTDQEELGEEEEE